MHLNSSRESVSSCLNIRNIPILLALLLPVAATAQGLPYWQDVDASYAERDLNVGFSGGEKKKAEILQLLMLRPRLAILDETDSGLDVDAVKTVSKGIEEYRRSVGGTLIIITHNAKILEELSVDKTHILSSGRIVKEGSGQLAFDVLENGFEKYIEEV